MLLHSVVAFPGIINFSRMFWHESSGSLRHFIWCTWPILVVLLVVVQKKYNNLQEVTYTLWYKVNIMNVGFVVVNGEQLQVWLKKKTLILLLFFQAKHKTRHRHFHLVVMNKSEHKQWFYVLITMNLNWDYFSLGQIIAHSWIMNHESLCREKHFRLLTQFPSCLVKTDSGGRDML